MDKELVSSACMYGGGTVTSLAAPAAFTSESSAQMLLLILSAIGATATVCGLIYTVWNGNRNFNLAREEHDMKRKGLNGEDSQRHLHLVAGGQEPESA